MASWSRERLWWPAAILVLCLPVSGLLYTVVLSSGDPYSGKTFAGPLGLHNYFAVGRTYLFRLSVVNGMRVALIAVLFVLILHAGVSSWADRRRPNNGFLAAIWLAPSLLPASIAVLLWGTVLRSIIWGSGVWGPLAATAWMVAWRVLPAAVVASRWLWPTSRRNDRWFLAAVAAYVALVDPVVVLLLSGGGPFNRTQTISSWTFTSLWVSRNWGEGAAMAVMLGAVVSLVLFLVWLPSRLCGREDGRKGRRPTGSLRPWLGWLFWVSTLAPGVIALGLLTEERSIWPDLDALAILGYWRWLANTLVVGVGGGVAGGLLAQLLLRRLSGGRASWAARRAWIIWAVFVPVAYVGPAYLGATGFRFPVITSLTLMTAGVVVVLRLAMAKTSPCACKIWSCGTWLGVAIGMQWFVWVLAMDPAPASHLAASGVVLYIGDSVATRSLLGWAGLGLWVVVVLVGWLGRPFLWIGQSGEKSGLS